MPAKKSPRQKDVRSLLQKKLGKDTAKAILEKIEKMKKEEKSASAIRKTVLKDLSMRMDNAFGDIWIVIQKKGE